MLNSHINYSINPKPITLLKLLKSIVLISAIVLVMQGLIIAEIIHLRSWPYEGGWLVMAEGPHLWEAAEGFITEPCSGQALEPSHSFWLIFSRLFHVQSISLTLRIFLIV